MEERKLRVAITHGDTNGVGYELILKTFDDPTMMELCTPIIYGSPKVASYHRKVLDMQTQFSIISTPEEAKENRYISQPTKEEDTTTGGASNFSALDYAGTIDFTYPEAVNWYKNQLLKPLLDMGVTCIKTDFGENIHMDHHYHGMTPERLNNIYSLL